MKIAFYAPLKSPDHPVPSGDRLMARLLMQAMTMAGHEVEVASPLRSFLKNPDDPAYQTIKRDAQQEIDRLQHDWQENGKPDIWFCYHPYYKAPDLIGPALCREFSVAYVSSEASYSNRRNIGHWAENQHHLLESINAATVNLCFTRRDHDGLLAAAAGAKLEMFPPFIDPAIFLAPPPDPTPYRLATVAMMRSGDKLDSYVALAKALAKLPADLPWTLDIVGDGPERQTVEALFTDITPQRVLWHGQKVQQEIAQILSKAALYLWPGHGEAYGLAYLEAQAAGLPVIAEHTAGVPEVVQHGKTGLLTPAGDSDAYALAIEQLLRNDNERQAMALNARQFVQHERSLTKASQCLNTILSSNIGTSHDRHFTS
ncbi:glycosyltransferase [Agrobacterium sp.]|jgi:glycosyltransferase involved in cell wall biosynthesis|uniref:glycosyltransferase family 4 protein n=1 Tax=Agrobacterium sp. TaxID=361 RepID=UPI0028ACD0C8|nr:glycosyltransferase [Agrobacterium sp.]